MRDLKDSRGPQVRRVPLLLLGALVLAGSGVAHAQSSPDGCTIPVIGDFPTLGPAFKDLTDVVLLGACTAHDECYRECAIMDSLPFHYAHQADCDFELTVRLHAECLALTAVAAEIDPDVTQTWFEACESVVVTTSILVPILGRQPYFKDQCTHCNCYTTACNQTLLPSSEWMCDICQPWDPSCGGYCPSWDPNCYYRCNYPYDPFCGGGCPYWDPFCGGCSPWDPFCGGCSPWDPFCGGCSRWDPFCGRGCSPWEFFCPYY